MTGGLRGGRAVKARCGAKRLPSGPGRVCLLLIVLFFALPFRQASAQDPAFLLGPVEAAGFSREEVRFLQFALAMRSDYNGMLDGAWGKLSEGALERYAWKELGTGPTNLTLAALVLSVADEVVSNGWNTLDAETYGLSLLFPFEAVQSKGTQGSFENWSHQGSTLAYSFARADTERTSGFHDFVARQHAGSEPVYELRRDGTAITTARTSEGSLYARSEFVEGAWSTVMLSASNADAGLMRAVSGSIRRGPGEPLVLPDQGRLVAILDMVALLAQEDTTPGTPPVAPPQAGAGVPGGNGFVSTGTGFVVNSGGDVLTNAHVVEGCRRYEVDDRPARLVAVSDAFDLALLNAPERAGLAHAVFAATPARLNSDVTAAGFPLSGILEGLNVTRGAVSSLKGLRGSSFDMQISAPVQPGNSGGPLFGSSGQVVGVVVARLDKRAVEEQTGALPENVNFAVRGEAAKLFLAQNGVEITVGAQGPVLPPPEIAERAVQVTVRVTCQ